MTYASEIIHLVDDDEALRKALRRLLISHGYEVRSHASAQAFLQSLPLPLQGIHCLLLDISMPGLDGLALQERLAAESVQVPIVFLTATGDIPKSVRAIKAGAVDFLTKPVTSEELLNAIHAALKIAKASQMDRSHIATLIHRYQTLTPREREVMSHVVAGRLNKQIAAALGTSEQTIKFHRGHVMSKMGVESVADLVRAASTLPEIGPHGSST
jgi:FixJ family two-component response regulator